MRNNGANTGLISFSNQVILGLVAFEGCGEIICHVNGVERRPVRQPDLEDNPISDEEQQRSQQHRK